MKKKTTEFYVVSWCDHDKDENTVDYGLITTLFSTKGKARKRIFALEKDFVKDMLGDENPKKVVDEAVVIDVGSDIVFHFTEPNIYHHYIIRKFDGSIVE